MGRFSDLWASGKFILKDKQEREQFQQQQAASEYQGDQPEFAIPDSAKVIFDALKSRRGQETGRWLREVTSDAVVQEASQAPKAAEAAGVNVFDELVSFMNALFKEFSELAYEFNKTAVGTEMLLSLERPTVLEKRSDEVWYRPVQKSCRGRLTTRRWAMFFRGEEKKISIMLLPASQLLSFAAGQGDDEAFPPFMELQYGDDGSWSIGGENVPNGAVKHLAKELLGDLIRVSSGAMSETELFSDNQDKPQLGQNMGVGYAAAAPAPVSSQTQPALALQTNTVHDACDVVDAAVDQELKRLYALATQIQPTSPDAESIRKQISAVEAFHMKMLDAFEQYTHTTQPATRTKAETPQPGFELLK